jgi:hypothetical protein
MIQVIDNVISKIYQDRLEETFFSKSISWILNQNLTEAISGNGEVGFTHPLINPEYRSEYFNYTLPLIYEISEKSGVNVSQILLARSFLQLPSLSAYKNDLFHVDLKQKHIVFLYYINDSDGDTLITNQKFFQNKKQFFPRDYEMQIQEKITPKKGRAVIFDGMLFHAAGIPKINTRCVLNFDIVP